MIADDKIQEIRTRSSILEITSDYLTLKKAGQNYLGLCPFHSEKTPSFTVSEEKGIFHCFGCGEGGNVFTFLMKHEQLAFPEAVEQLAKRYGIRIEPRHREGTARTQEARSDLARLNEKATGIFHGDLIEATPQGARARQYLTGRGLDERVIEQFKLGFAPRGDRLATIFRKEGIPLQDAVRAGLLVEKEPGRYRDRFFDRIIFPIVDPGGKVVGFGGRVMGEGMPKYLNSPETPLFHKGSQLYGLGQAREGIRAQDRVLVVEGYLDVLALVQFGVTGVVATLGTALTPDHVRILGRYTKNIIALFDGDAAGRKAAARSLEIFLEAGLWGQAAFLPKGEDPDSFVRKHGSESLGEIVDRAIPLADFYLTWLQTTHGTTFGGRSQIAAEVSRVLAKIRNPFDHDLLARRAAELLGIREELLRQTAGQNLDHRKQGPPRVASPSAPRVQGRSQQREDRAEASLVALMLRFPGVLQRMRDQPLEKLVSDKWRDVIRMILDSKGYQPDVSALTQDMTPERASEISALALKGQEFREEERDKMTGDCLFFLQRRYLRRVAEELRKAIRAAEETRDDKVKKERMRQWQEVVQKERKLERARLSL